MEGSRREEHRRKDEGSVAELLKIMRSLNQDFQSQASLLLEVKKDIDSILDAFPPGGLIEHRLFHEREATDRKDAHELKQSIYKNLSSWGIIGTLAIVGAAVVLYIQVKLIGSPTK